MSCLDAGVTLTWQNVPVHSTVSTSEFISISPYTFIFGKIIINGDVIIGKYSWQHKSFVGVSVSNYNVVTKNSGTLSLLLMPDADLYRIRWPSVTVYPLNLSVIPGQYRYYSYIFSIKY